jgi:PAS domain S-box-containing protein
MASNPLDAEVYREVIERATDAVGIRRDEGFIYVNPSMVALLEANSAADLLGRSLFEFVHPDYRLLVESRLLRLREGKSNELAHEQLITLRGHVIDVEVAATPLKLDGAPAFAVIVRDISERIAAQKRLEQSERVASLGRLAATVAHEFNNVLMGIQPYAEILQRRAAENPAVEKPANQILQAVQRGKAITTEILRFARPSECALVPLNLGKWLERFSERVRDMNLTKITVNVIPPESEAWILADATQIDQVITNMVLNARDAMSEGGTLTLGGGKCEERPGGVEDGVFLCIAVSDTGEGIPKDLHSRIFEPLFTTKSRGGTGLGLAVAQQIVGRHNGLITVESEPGHGSTFHVFLRTCPPPER